MVVRSQSSNKNFRKGGKKFNGLRNNHGESFNVRLPDGSCTTWIPPKSEHQVLAFPPNTKKIVVKLPGHLEEAAGHGDEVQSGNNQASLNIHENLIQSPLQESIRSSSSLSSSSSLLTNEEIYTPGNSRSTTPLDATTTSNESKQSNESAKPHVTIVDSSVTTIPTIPSSPKSYHPSDFHQFYPQQQPLYPSYPYYYYPPNAAPPYYDPNIYPMVAIPSNDLSLMPIMIQQPYMYIPSDYPSAPNVIYNPHQQQQQQHHHHHPFAYASPPPPPPPPPPQPYN